VLIPKFQSAPDLQTKQQPCKSLIQNGSLGWRKQWTISWQKCSQCQIIHGLKNGNRWYHSFTLIYSGVLAQVSLFNKCI